MRRSLSSLLCLLCAISACKPQQRPEEATEQIVEAPPEPIRAPTTAPEELPDEEPRECKPVDAARVIADLLLGDIDPLDVEILRAGIDLDQDTRQDILAQAYLGDQRKIGIYIDPDCPQLIGQFIAETVEVLETSHHNVSDIRAWSPGTCHTDLGGTSSLFHFDGESYELSDEIDCPCDVNAWRHIDCPQP